MLPDKVFFGHGRDYFSFRYIYNVVSTFLNIGNDVSREEYGHTFFFQLGKNVQDFVAGERVETTCRFIQDKHFRSVGESEKKVQLHLHSLRKLQRSFRLIQTKQIQIPAISIFVPGLIEPFYYIDNVPDLPSRIPADRSRGIPDEFFDLRLIAD